MTDHSHTPVSRPQGHDTGSMTSGIPVMLQVAGRKCVIVGGGQVALRRATALIQAAAEVTVIAPVVDQAIASLPLRVIPRRYHRGDLDGALLVVVATDDPAVNEQVAKDAREIGVLVNRADDAESGDITIPAHTRLGPLTLAVHTGGGSASASAVIRDQLAASLDPHWPTLLTLAREYRPVIQRTIPDTAQRRDRLARLTDTHAMDLLKRSGELALRNYLERLADPRQPSE